MVVIHLILIPMFIRTDNSLQIFDSTTFKSLLSEWIRYTKAFHLRMVML